MNTTTMRARPINTAGLSPEAIRRAAHDRLEEIVATGRQNSVATIQRIFTEIPEDSIVRAPALGFEVLAAEKQPGRLVMKAPQGHSWSVHQNALGQLSERLGVPMAYAKKLIGTDEPWAHRLVETTLREHALHATGPKGSPAKFLVRSVGGQARGVLSDTYRRLDSRPLLEAFVESLDAVKAVPFEGFGGDLSVRVRAIIPQVHEPIPGEFMVFGLDWSNSDFGRGTYDVSAFALRLICLNGMIGSSRLRQIHLGKRLDENLEFSAKTYALDTKTMVSATRDIVAGALGPKAIASQVEAIREAASKEIGIAAALRGVESALTKAERDAVKSAFEGQDVINLPPERTAWRFSNALSWVANAAEDPERKEELQALAGVVVPGFNQTKRVSKLAA